MKIQDIYQRRFNADRAFRNMMWDVLCREFFQRYIPKGAVVLDVAAGYCEFINHIQAGKKIALDLNPDTKKYADADVQVLGSRSTDMSLLPDGSCDIVFVSNFFEHLTKKDIIGTLSEVRRVLRENGKFLILQPNIRFCYKDYWNFFDHITPLDDKSLAEVLETNGFNVVEMRPKFLPFSARSRFPRHVLFIKLYLKMRFLHQLFGKQAFAVAQKT